MSQSNGADDDDDRASPLDLREVRARHRRRDGLFRVLLSICRNRKWEEEVEKFKICERPMIIRKRRSKQKNLENVGLLTQYIIWDDILFISRYCLLITRHFIYWWGRSSILWGFEDLSFSISNPALVCPLKNYHRVCWVVRSVGKTIEWEILISKSSHYHKYRISAHGMECNSRSGDFLSLTHFSFFSSTCLLFIFGTYIQCWAANSSECRVHVVGSQVKRAQDSQTNDSLFQLPVVVLNDMINNCVYLAEARRVWHPN